MLGDEWLLHVDDVVDAAVCMEVGLDVLECDDGTIGAAATELAVGCQSRRETDGVVEGESEGLVDLFTALAAIEQVLLDVLENREERTTSCVRRRVFAVRTSDTTRQST